MIDLLHVAGIKMLGVRKNQMRGRSLFASGGLYLALEQAHSDLAIRRDFGDFTSGFSHLFGVALSVMAMSEAFGIDWDQLVPIPVHGKRVLDYEASIPRSQNWLRFECKGITTDASLSSARSSAYKKKNASQSVGSAGSSAASATAKLGILVRAARERRERGSIEIIDPEIPEDSNTRQASNQRAGRYLHYAGVARFAGLRQVADEFLRRAEALLAKNHDLPRAQSLTLKDNQFQWQGHTLVGVQWHPGDTDEIWFHHAVDFDRLRTIIETDVFPEATHFNSDVHGKLERVQTETNLNSFSTSFLPDGSYFGIGSGPVEGLVRVDQVETNFNRLEVLKLE